MRNFYFAALILLAAACKQNTETTTETPAVVHDTVVVKEKTIREAPKTTTVIKTETPKVETPPAKKPWEDKMAEYHEVRCRQHAGKGTATDAIRQMELYRELIKIRDRLNKDDRFYFATALAKAEDMETCAK